ncbi:MAG: hypothetical protein PHD67_05625 [Oscillospiraceae bacterium]|nr:hypothetical protein [Oscillospiraceae bacterium]
MPASLFGIAMIAAAVTAVAFAVLTVIRLSRGRKAGWRKYALLISLALGVSSFIALGSTYEAPETTSRETGMETQAPEIALNAKPDDAFSQGGNSAGTDSTPVITEEPAKNTGSEGSSAPSASQPETPGHEPSASPDTEEAVTTPPAATPEQSEEPDYDLIMSELKKEVAETASAALSGRFDTSVEPEIVFNPYNGSLLIKAQASDNLTASLIRKGIIADMRDTLEAIRFDAEGFELPAGKESVPIFGIETVAFNITFPTTNAKGVTEPVIVLKAEFSKATLQAINWENKLSVNIEKLADSFWYIND